MRIVEAITPRSFSTQKPGTGTGFRGLEKPETWDRYGFRRLEET